MLVCVASMCRNTGLYSPLLLSPKRIVLFLLFMRLAAVVTCNLARQCNVHDARRWLAPHALSPSLFHCDSPCVTCCVQTRVVLDVLRMLAKGGVGALPASSTTSSTSLQLQSTVTPSPAGTHTVYCNEWGQGRLGNGANILGCRVLLFHLLALPPLLYCISSFSRCFFPALRVCCSFT
jgi:hypothetical protein